MFESDPLAVHRGKDGEVQFTDTGDNMIDQWEADIADGREPDLWDAFTPEAKEQLAKRYKQKNPFINPKSSISEVVDAVHKRATDSASPKYFDPTLSMFGDGE